MTATSTTGASTDTRRSRHQLIEEAQEAQLWETLSQRSLIGSKQRLQLRRNTAGSIIVEPSLHSIVEREAAAEERDSLEAPFSVWTAETSSLQNLRTVKEENSEKAVAKSSKDKTANENMNKS